jgi:hypothetical protein
VGSAVPSIDKRLAAIAILKPETRSHQSLIFIKRARQELRKWAVISKETSVSSKRHNLRKTIVIARFPMIIETL